MRFTPTNRRAWVWVWRSAGRSSRPTAAVFGRPQPKAQVRPSNLLFHRVRSAHLKTSQQVEVTLSVTIPPWGTTSDKTGVPKLYSYDCAAFLTFIVDPLATSLRSTASLLGSHPLQTPSIFSKTQ